MAIEPINSMMTIQAQQYSNQGTAAQASTSQAKPVAEFTEGSAQGTEQVDARTVTVDNTNKANNDGANGGTGAQTFAQSDEVVKKEVHESIQNSEERQDKVNDMIKKSVEDMNKRMFNSEAQFGIHEGTNRVTIKIVDKTTKEVIKELPPEKTLDMIAKAWEMAGIMVDERR